MRKFDYCFLDDGLLQNDIFIIKKFQKTVVNFYFIGIIMVKKKTKED